MVHQVSAGALIGPDGVLLVHRRAERRYYPDCWDLPGGHVEPGESGVQALVRELREELGVTAAVEGEPRTRIVDRTDAEDGMDLQIWVVEQWSGTPRNLAADEHDDVRWFRAQELSSLRLAHPAYSALLAGLTA